MTITEYRNLVIRRLHAFEVEHASANEPLEDACILEWDEMFDSFMAAHNRSFLDMWKSLNKVRAFTDGGGPNSWKAEDRRGHFGYGTTEEEACSELCQMPGAPNHWSVLEENQ